MEREKPCKIGEGHGFLIVSLRLTVPWFLSMRNPLSNPMHASTESLGTQRKSFIVNDFERRIISVTIGFPGSTNEARIVRNTRSLKSEHDHLHYSGKQFELAHSAFSCLVQMYCTPDYTLQETECLVLESK